MEDILYNRSLKIVRFINSPVPSNTYLIFDIDSKRSLVVDPGSKHPDELIRYIRNNGLSVDYIILTHEHFDHCWGVNALKEIFNCQVVASRQCAEWLKIPRNYFNKLYYDSDELFSIQHVDIKTEDIAWRLQWDRKEIRFIDTPGHSNKSICISICSVLFSGDTMIFNTQPLIKKQYGASVVDLYDSIRKLYSIFQPDTLVLPGHGQCFKMSEMREYFDTYFMTKLKLTNG